MLAHKVNEWRIVPRIAVFIFLYLLITVTNWFMGLKQPDMSQATFASAVWGAGAMFFNFYMTTGGTTPPSNRRTHNGVD